MSATEIVWIPGDKPETPKGSQRRLWVTLKHKDTGKLSVGLMTYLNGHVMPCAECCDPPACAVPHKPDEDGYAEEYEWTGWTQGHCEYCETEWMWSSHYMEIVAHAHLETPKPYGEGKRDLTAKQRSSEGEQAGHKRRSFYVSAGEFSLEKTDETAAIRVPCECGFELGVIRAGERVTKGMKIDCPRCGADTVPAIVAAVEKWEAGE